MKSKRYVIIVLLSILCEGFSESLPAIEYKTIDDCKSLGGTKYFDISQMTCLDCAQTSDFQKISDDGLQCICQDGYKLIKDYGGAQIECEKCPAGQTVGISGWECVQCDTGSTSQSSSCLSCPSSKISATWCDFTSTTRCHHIRCLSWFHSMAGSACFVETHLPVCLVKLKLLQVVSFDGWECVLCQDTSACLPCEAQTVAIERALDGSWYNTPATRTCETCSDFTHSARQGSRCDRCNQILSVLDEDRLEERQKCRCDNEIGGICFADENDYPDLVDSLYQISFGDDVVESAFFYENVQASAGMCRDKYANSTACQVQGNMCTMLRYDEDVPNACTMHKEGIDDDDWPGTKPWLYYLEDDADDVLTDEGLTTVYTFPSSTLDLIVAQYSVNGSFLGYADTRGGLLQLCGNTRSILDAAYDFGTFYNTECDIPVGEFWDSNKYPTVFYDVYLQFEENGQKMLYSIPLLIDDYKDSSGDEVNKGSRDGWQLVRRFFMVDNISGKERTKNADENSGTSNTEAKAVRFAQEITMYIQLRGSDGLIYPPYLHIKYGTANLQDREAGKSATIKFEVKYQMRMKQYKKNISIAAGVLSGLALFHAFLLTWSWSKRAGKLAVDFVSISKYFLFCLGTLGNVFFVVAFGSSLWWFIFYKNQNSVYLIVPDYHRDEFLVFLSMSFIFKFLQVIHIIACQVTVDIFFIDWERPKNQASAGGDSQKGQEASVSIWRTYFLANEWNELQVTRKINPIFQIFCVIFFLHVVGFENWTTTDPHTTLSHSRDEYVAKTNQIFRYAIGALVYLLVAICQWLFYTLFYERFVEDKVRQYVDLCSMSNISVFILENAQFGYYIHGRSVHGRADTGMKEMHENLKREEEDLCGQRGLLPNTELQSFEMAVPRKLRIQYDRVLLPINTQQQGAGAGHAPPSQTAGYNHVDNHTVQCIQAYSTINRFLQNFIDHSLQDIDYVINDHVLMESVLNMEFQDSTERGIFYNDTGHSFDSVLFFGHETTLTLFEITLFSIVDLIWQDFVLAGVITFIIMELLTMLRNNLGRSNLAKKTLVDKRFLI